MEVARFYEYLTKKEIRVHVTQLKQKKKLRKQSGAIDCKGVQSIVAPKNEI